MNYNRYLKVEIAVPKEQEAEEIIGRLLDGHLIAGGHYMPGITKHWWRGSIDTAEYWYVTGYTIGEYKEKIIETVRAVSSEEVPGIVFFEIDDANKDFLKWIEKKHKKPM